jgi:hypothetical protein
VRFALNVDKGLDAEGQAVYCTLWEEGFSDLDLGSLNAAFVACIRSLTYKTMPTIADVRKHLDQAQTNAAEEGAAQKWDQVRQYIRLHYHPDLSVNSGPRISERTRRAINAAGGLTYLSECLGDALVFARKRFIESYLSWESLEQDKYLLPDGELKNALSVLVEAKALPFRTTEVKP